MARTDKTHHVLGGSRRLELVTLAIALALAAAAPAGAAVSTEKRLVSPQYQAKSVDTAATGEAADPTKLNARQAGSTAWYQPKNARYQLQHYLFHRSEGSLSALLPLQRGVVASLQREKPPQIIAQIDRRDAISRSDARLLLRLGLGLGLAYLVFLAAWFWRTRNRTQSAARLVRF